MWQVLWGSDHRVSILTEFLSSCQMCHWIMSEWHVRSAHFSFCGSLMEQWIALFDSTQHYFNFAASLGTILQCAYISFSLRGGWQSVGISLITWRRAVIGFSVLSDISLKDRPSLCINLLEALQGCLTECHTFNQNQIYIWKTLSTLKVICLKLWWVLAICCQSPQRDISLMLDLEKCFCNISLD